jgi:hypothetical protein
MPTTRLQALADRILGTQSFGLSNYDVLEADVNYLVVAGANIVSANTITITNEFHIVTGGVTIQSIVDGLNASPGQQVRLLCQSALTIANNGGGGNIRTSSGADRAVKANDVVLLTYDGTYWWASSPDPSQYAGTIAATNTVTETDLTNALLSIPANALGPNGYADIDLIGDIVNNSGAARNGLRFKLKLGAGATVVIDTSADAGNAIPASATRYPLSIRIRIQNVGATNVQAVRFEARYGCAGVAIQSATAWSTGEGVSNVVTVAGLSMSTWFMQGYNAAAIDTTAACPVVVTVINPTATATFETKAFATKMVIKQ